MELVQQLKLKTKTCAVFVSLHQLHENEVVVLVVCHVRKSTNPSLVADNRWIDQPINHMGQEPRRKRAI